MMGHRSWLPQRLLYRNGGLASRMMCRYLWHTAWRRHSAPRPPSDMTCPSANASVCKVEVPTDNPLGPCPAVVCGDLKGARAAIIVIQEWWGMNQHILDTAQEITQMSKFPTLVPDLYRGKVATDRETAGHYMADLQWGGAVSDVDACARYLRSAGCQRVGITGFCMGGAICLGVAAVYPSTVDAAVPFYGIPRQTALPHDLSRIRAPLQCHFGQRDAVVGLSSPADYEALAGKLTAAGVVHELHTYDAQHAFANATSANFDKAAYDLSFSRMNEFFQKHLV